MFVYFLFIKITRKYSSMLIFERGAIGSNLERKWFILLIKKGGFLFILDENNGSEGKKQGLDNLCLFVSRTWDGSDIGPIMEGTNVDAINVQLAEHASLILLSACVMINPNEDEEEEEKWFVFFGSDGDDRLKFGNCGIDQTKYFGNVQTVGEKGWGFERHHFESFPIGGWYFYLLFTVDNVGYHQLSLEFEMYIFNLQEDL